MNLTQCERILTIMLKNKEKQYWTAKDFQRGENFIGYEASARMSDLMNMYPEILIVGRDGRFRTLSIDWEKEQMINELKKKFELI